MVRMHLFDIPGRDTPIKTSLLFVLSALVSSTAAQSATASIPSFVEGYYQLSSQTAWSTISCFQGRVFTSAGDYATCCDDTSSGCAFPTACSDHTVFFVNDYYVCNKTEDCHTMTVYDSIGSDNYAKDIFCYDHWDVETVYRTTTTPSTITSSTVTSSTPTPRPPIITSLPIATLTSTSPAAATPTKPRGRNGPDPDPGSQAWIAGAVIGPVAGVAIIAGLAIWFFQRRKTAANAEPEPAGVAAALRPQYGQMGNAKYGGGGEDGGAQPMSELPASFYTPKQGGRPLSELGFG